MNAQRHERQGAYRRKIEEGRAEGQAEGRAEGRAAGRAEGRAAGQAAGEAKAIIKLLRSRGIDLTDDQRDTILTCTDIEQLDTWFDRALKADTARDVFTP
ncbi:hypothetical protein ACFQZ2_00460 [Streptomonospora algeriensis]